MSTQTAEKSAGPQRGFSDALCPRCGRPSVSVDLADVAALHCYGCDSDFSADDICQLIGSWTAVLAWLDTAPVVGAGAEPQKEGE